MTQPANRRLVTEDRFLPVESTANAAYTAVTNYASLSPNYIINGAFDINQRNFTTSSSGGYGFDRWVVYQSGGTSTYSAQTFTPGSGPGGNESANFARIVTSGQSAAGDYSQLFQAIENVRLLANKTVTISFWAKAGSGTPKVAIELQQNFGSGGSPSPSILFYTGQVTLSTSWTRYSVTYTIPSISGKTIGTSANTSYTGIALWVSAGTTWSGRTGSMGVQNNTFDIWGVQVEDGSVATAFRRNAPSIQAELSACQRYYFRKYSAGLGNIPMAIGTAQTATQGYAHIEYPVPMRISPNAIDFSAIAATDYTGYTNAVSAISISSMSPSSALLYFTSSGMTGFRPVFVVATANGYIGLNAEL